LTVLHVITIDYSKSCAPFEIIGHVYTAPKQKKELLRKKNKKKKQKQEHNMNYCLPALYFGRAHFE